MENDPVRALDELLSRLRAVLSGSGPAADESTTGTSDEGLVSVEVGADGYVRSITADPAVLRRPADELAAEIVTAVNRAVDARPNDVNRSNLLRELRALQEESSAHMQQMSGHLVSAVKQLEAR